MGQTKRPSLETFFSKRFHLRLPLLALPHLEAAARDGSPEFVAHTSNNGAIGVLVATALPPDEIHRASQIINGLTSRPWALSLEGPKGNPGFELQFEAVLKISPSIFIFTGEVLNRTYIDRCSNRGIVTVGESSNVYEAMQLESSGVSFVVTPELLLQQVLEKIKKPVIAACSEVGGEVSGEKLASLIKLGAAAVKVEIKSVALLHELERDALGTLRP